MQVERYIHKLNRIYSSLRCCAQPSASPLHPVVNGFSSWGFWILNHQYTDDEGSMVLGINGFFLLTSVFT